MRKLTQKQEEVLLEIKDFCIMQGYFPKATQLAEKFNVTREAIRYFLDMLIRKGYITKKHNGIYLLTTLGNHYEPKLTELI